MLYLGYAYIRNQLPASYLNRYLSLIPNEMRDKIVKYRRWEDTQLSLYGKLLLLKGLKRLSFSNLSLCNIQYTPFYRPYIEGGIDFNISHSGKIVLCVVSDTYRVGIDIEEIKPIYLEDFEGHWTSEEWTSINNNQNNYDEFYKFWTRKEAVIKAEGSGLTLPLHTIDVINETVHINNTIWYLKRVNINPDYFAHLATNRNVSEEIHTEEVTFENDETVKIYYYGL